MLWKNFHNKLKRKYFIIKLNSILNENVCVPIFEKFFYVWSYVYKWNYFEWKWLCFNLYLTVGASFFKFLFYSTDTWLRGYLTEISHVFWERTTNVFTKGEKKRSLLQTALLNCFHVSGGLLFSFPNAYLQKEMQLIILMCIK